MSNITRSEAIKTLKEHLSHWERLLQEHICEEQEGIDTISALKLAIASLETDEAYQLEYESTTKNDLALIHTMGLDEGIRCAMCTNSMKSDRGCDGSCVVNNAMYKKVMDVIENHIIDTDKMIEPTTKNDLANDVPDNNVGNIDCILRADALRVAKNEYLRGWHNALCKALSEKYSIHCEEGNFSVIQEETIIGLGLSMNCALGKDVESYMSTMPSVTPQEPKSEWEQDHAILKAHADGANEILEKLRAEIEAKCCITVGRENDGAITLYDVFEIIDKYKAEVESHESEE